MTIQIVKFGNFRVRIWAGRCTHCSGQFEWHDEDCLNIVDDQRNGMHSTITCPTKDCERTVYGYPARLK